MDLLIDLATMAVMLPSGVPLTDLSLVRGDKLPLRITLLDEGVPVTPSGVRPALAVKTALGDDTLVLAATNLEPVDDALGMAYIGSLSVNTTQLIAAMGSADSIDLVGEVVLMAGDGSQRTSSLIRVAVRQDIMPADIVPPEDVVADWEDMVAASLASQLPDALHEAGMHVTPQGGTTTLTTNMTPSHRRDVTYYRLPLSHRNIVGHLSSSYTIDSVILRSNPSSTPVCVEVYKLTGSAYTLLGRSLNAIAPADSNQDYTWTYPPGLTVRSDDTIILRLVGEDGADAVLKLAVTQVAAGNPESGADIVDGLVDPQRVINPDYPDIRFFLYTRLGMSYTSGVSVGGVELATREHFDALVDDVVATGEQVNQDAQTASTAATTASNSATSAASSATAAQQALDAIPQVDAAGNMTLAGGLTTAAVINANGGINIPVAPSMDTQAARFREVQLLQEMEFSPLRTYFRSPNPVPFGVLLDRFWWAANRDNMPAWTVATAEFSHISPDYFNFDYDSLTSCYFPMSCGLGFGRCFDSIAIGNVAFNADYASLDGDPFVTPADYMRYWVDVQIGRPANAQCSVFVRMFRWDRDSNSLVNTEYRSSVPDSLALRGVALSMTSEFSGVWLVGFDKKVGRLVSYKVLPETFEGSSYRGVLSNNRLSLAKAGGHGAMGVHAPRYYGGTVVGEWCSLIQAS